MPNRGTIYNALGTTQYAQATVASYPITNPLFTGGYVFSEDEVAGVVTANNFLSLSNPVGSGKTILLAGVFVSSSTIGGVSPPISPLRGYRSSVATGGTLQAVSAIAKVRTNMPDPVGQIRIGSGVTATLGAAWFNSPATLASASESPGFVHQIPSAIPAGAFTLLPGEGTTLRTELGSTQQLWNISIAWSEL